MQSEEFYQMQIKYYKDEYMKYDHNNPIPQAMDIYPYLSSRTRNEDYLIILTCLKDKKNIPARIMQYVDNHMDKLRYLKKRTMVKEELYKKYIYYKAKYKAEYPNSAPEFLKSIGK